MKGAGYKGIGLLSPSMSAAPLGTPPWDFDPNLATLTPRMAKRATTVFASSLLSQGTRLGSATAIHDRIALVVGNQVAPFFYGNIDLTQVSFAFRITPEWNAGDVGLSLRYIFYCGTSNTIAAYIDGTNLRFILGNQTHVVSIAGWVAGTTYNVVLRADSKNTLDGTNYICVSVNDTHTFGVTTAPVISNIPSDIRIGSTQASYPSNTLIEGFTVYRRVLWDGAYGVNVGNGDEVALIAAGVDPCTITGSWDVVLCVPTNATTGQIVTGTGEAWSHPHGSNVLTRGFLSDRYYGGGQWGVKFNGTSSYIDCGSDASLDDIPAASIIQVECWALIDASVSVESVIVAKGNRASEGWDLYMGAGLAPTFLVRHATVSNGATSSATVVDGKWHHWIGHYDNTTKISQIAIDGVWGAASAASTGAYITDAGMNLNIGRNGIGNPRYLKGSVGWVIIHNDAHYTPGTNFVPPRAFPGADVEGWLLNEGTGAVTVAQVTSPANDGNLNNCTWEPQWHDSGSPVIDYSVIGSDTYIANVGSDASIDDLADGAFTIDGWLRYPKVTSLSYIYIKGDGATTGYRFRINSNGTITLTIYCVTTAANSTTSVSVEDGLWHYIKVTFDDAGDRKPYIYIDNVLVAQSQTAGVGAIVSDAGQDGHIGRSGLAGLKGAHGWWRLSNSVRGAGMIERSNPPAVDANTMAQWNVTEGAGTTLADATGVNNGTMAGTYSWGITPAMEVDSPGARVYAWGHVFGNDAADEGIEQTLTGLAAGSRYVIRALGYSEDGVGQPEIIVYDETNAAVLLTVTGTTTSTEKAPDKFIFSFELPTVARYGVGANCTSITVRLINTSATGVVGWDQIELLANLVDNPGLEIGAGNPFIPLGWTNVDLDLNDTEAEAAGGTCHSGNCVEWNTGADAEGMTVPITIAVNKFMAFGFWAYCDGSAAMRAYNNTAGEAYLQFSSSTRTLTSPNTAAWTLTKGVYRIAVANPIWRLQALTGATGDRFTDDIYAVLLDDVSLTIFPTSAVNSAEDGGLRVDGFDICTQPIPANRLFVNFGWIRVRMIPRHNDADVLKFGAGFPTVFEAWGDVNNYIFVYWPAANTLRLCFEAAGGGAQVADWATGGGAIVAGGNYVVEIRWTPGQMVMIVNGVVRATINAATAFTTIPATFYAGSLQAGTNQIDAVLLAP